MEIRQLRYFIKSAELLNFTEAAKALNIAESTLSQQIKQLEVELEISLFKRTKKHIELTEAGETLLPYARRTVADSEDAVQVISDLNNLKTGTLRIGGTFSLCSLLADTLLKFSKKYPNIRITVECDTARHLLKMLKEHKVDMVLCFESSNTDECIESIHLFDSPLCAIMHRNHSLAAMKEISFEMLKSYSLALPAKGMHARELFENGLLIHKRQLKPQVELNDVNILFQLIKTKHWISILPQSTIINEEALKAIQLCEWKIEMRAALMSLKDNYQKNAAKEFTSMLLKILKI